MRTQIDTPRYRLSDFATTSPVMAALVALAERVVDADTSLLILGETGVGKEWLARAIHAQSPRSRGPFTAVNCAAVPPTLLESELFGHDKGAFTGAHKAHRGYFEAANGGVLFLDEIGEMAPELQAKLLRAVQEHRVQRIGSEVPIDVDVRIMAATSRNLERAMNEGDFRADLYYRLAVITLVVPPLRERREDIPVLLDSYRGEFASRLGRPVRRIAATALAVLCAYDWPGNVRELINVMERAVLLSTGDVIELDVLPQSVALERGPNGSGRSPLIEPQMYAEPLDRARDALVAAFERDYLERLLAATGGRLAEVADRAGIAPRTLYNKMQRHGLDKADYRNT